MWKKTILRCRHCGQHTNLLCFKTHVALPWTEPHLSKKHISQVDWELVHGGDHRVRTSSLNRVQGHFPFAWKVRHSNFRFRQLQLENNSILGFTFNLNDIELKNLNFFVSLEVVSSHLNSWRATQQGYTIMSDTLSIRRLSPFESQPWSGFTHHNKPASLSPSVTFTGGAFCGRGPNRVTLTCTPSGPKPHTTALSGAFCSTIWSP